jgi:hypothetical protein
MTLSPMEPNVSNNCGIGEQRSAGLHDKCPSAAHRRNLLGARVKQASLIMDMRSGESSTGGLHQESGYRRSQEREFCALQNRDTRFPDRWGTTVNRGGQVAGFRDGERTVDRSTAISHRGSGNRESEDACSLTLQTAKPRWRVWSRTCGSGHLDQGLFEGLAWKVHRQSENRESHGHKHHVIVNAETPMGGLAMVTRRQVIWIVF